MSLGVPKPRLDPALTRAEAVMAAIEARIAGRHLAPGARLPSVRAFAGILAPGNVFSVSQGATGYLRFNVAQCADPRIFAVLERAAPTAPARPRAARPA